MQRIALLNQAGVVVLILFADSVVQYARADLPALQAERPELQVIGAIDTDLAGEGDVLDDARENFLRGDAAAALIAARTAPSAPVAPDAPA